MAPRKTRPKARNGAGSIYYDKGRRQYRAQVMLPNGKRRTVRAATWAEADAELTRLKTDNESTGTPRPRGGRHAWTVGSWLDYWRANVIGARKGRHGNGISRSSLRRESWAADAIRAGLGDVSLWKLTPEDVEIFLGERARGIGVDRRAWTQDSCKDVKNFLARALDEAIARGHAPAPNKARQASIPGHADAPETRHALTEDQAAAMYDAARGLGTTVGAVIAFMLTTGVRPGEACSVRWRDIDMDAATLHIPHAKTPTGIRRIALSAEAFAVIRDRRNEAGLLARRPDGFVFPGHSARHVTEYALCDTVARLCHTLGITVGREARPIHPHELRHTVATLLVDHDVAAPQVAALLGDKLETVLRVYYHGRAVAGDVTHAPLAAIYGRAS